MVRCVRTYRSTSISDGRSPVALRITRGQTWNRSRSVMGPVFLIGGDSRCDLVLADPQFAAVHCYLLLRGREVWIRCLEDSPELTVDGEPVQLARLHHDQRIRTGPFELRTTIAVSNNDVSTLRGETVASGNPSSHTVRQLIGEVRRATGMVPPESNSPPLTHYRAVTTDHELTVPDPATTSPHSA